MNSQAFVFFRFLVVDVLFDVLRFPLWWYSRGLIGGAQWWQRQLKNAGDYLAIAVRAKNLGRPMFGDYTKEGRLISFGVRFVQLVLCAILYVGYFVFVTLLWAAWFALLPALIFLILYAVAQ